MILWGVTPAVSVLERIRIVELYGKQSNVAQKVERKEGMKIVVICVRGIK